MGIASVYSCGSGFDILLDEIPLLQYEPAPPPEVTLDAVLVPPENVHASACRSDGKIRIRWNVSLEQDGSLARKYFVYRFSDLRKKSDIPLTDNAVSTFDTNAVRASIDTETLVSTAELGTVNITSCTKTGGVIQCDDTPPANGNYIYRIRACNESAACSEFSSADMGSRGGFVAVSNFNNFRSQTYVSPFSSRPSKIAYFLQSGQRRFAILDKHIANVRIFRATTYTSSTLNITEIGSGIKTESSSPAAATANASHLYVAFPNENLIRKYLHSDYTVVNDTYGDAGTETVLNNASILYEQGGDLWVGDTGNYRVLKISGGNFGVAAQFSGLSGSDPKIGKFGTEPDEISQLEGLAVDANHVYVLDRGTSKVKIFDKSNGSFVASFGRKGANDSDFLMPTAIEVFNNKLYLLDKGNQKIVRYNLSTFCAEAKSRTMVLNSASGLAIDRTNNRLIVTNEGTTTIFRFNSSDF